MDLALTLMDFPYCSLVLRNPAGCLGDCLIDLESDSGSEQAGTGSPSLLHRDLAALGEGGCAGEPARMTAQGESKPPPLGQEMPVFSGNWVHGTFSEVLCI